MLDDPLIEACSRILLRSDVDPDGCWLWTGAHSVDGYGHIRVRKPASTQIAHRVIYRVLVGEIPEGLVIDHLCRKRSCVNPSHLEPVTIQENIRRGDGYAARARKKTHCIRGHEFTPENTIPDGTYRRCRKCRDAYNREYYMTHRKKQRSCVS